MKLSQSMLKMTIKLLILMMLFVIMFLISSFLYSARYWPDVYNYINANITIKRIPTISELELTVVEVDTYTTESYTTTDVEYIDVSTVNDFDIDEFMKDEIDPKGKVKRNIVYEQLKDYIELPTRPIFVDYVFLEEPLIQETPPMNAGTENEAKETKKDVDILKTVVTGVVIEDDLPKTTVNEEPAVTKLYYTVQPTVSDKIKRCVDEDDTTEQYLPETSETVIEHTTTIEGYLVGDDSKAMVDEVTEEPVVLTTKANENELVDDEHDERLMKDLVDMSKMSTRSSDDVEMVTGKPEKIMMLDPTCDGDAACIQFTKTVYPWVASIFVTSEDRGSQFSYYCDGALLTEKVIVTGARCISVSNKTWNPENVLVFLGKTNLQIFGGNEKVHKVKSLVLHPNFTLETEGKAASDLALLVLEDAVMFNENIQSACIHQDNSFEEAATTAWGLNGALYPILFNKQKSDQCFDKDEDVFCATYGNDVALCPSYGGIFASRQMDRWCLSGIFHGDPKERGICFNKNVQYTALRNFLKWIDDTVGMYKNGILL
ncbi:uncharacterized protein LOC124642432 isoform X1 [Helicoverpa zea]|uniref:uncharacterized protein LOC124642432 isoform X1 n=1 Tax=Helicoverpa zea TaxID=7113 RepID=UPI001F58C018|nr:uncharacterized protein LOC124642432 isoform X1 [Helicoverpa zea]